MTHRYCLKALSMLATTMLGPALRGLLVWDMNGTFDEVYSIPVMQAAREMMTP
ncbi:hypothetical protein [Caballeronia sordidicola]|uniref:hypothetical protein n=1 Tax=Caballeronia sordidicola TaxID=196367 RepID=UPI000A6FCCC8|nr:hypothetical protein [Caballeronia sordidicola]